MSENETDLTRKVIETLANCNKTDSCEICDARTYCTRGASSVKSALATALLAEMDKPKVWDGAPDNAIIAQVHFYKAAKTYATPTAVPEVYTRELPKSRARVIAEEAWADCHSDMTTKEEDIKRIESAILKALAEKEAGK